MVMKPFSFLGVFALSAAALGTPACALSDAARDLAGQEIAAACEGRPGSFDPAGLTERDLDGDGRDDLILSHEHIHCEGSPARSIFCGMQLCSLQFHVWREGRLAPAGEILGSLGWIGEGPAPVIATYGQGGRQALWRWNGHAVAPAD
jgi:hypothetical protein